MDNAVKVEASGMFRGVEIGWMQAQWRDCADKVAQMRIFRDMTSARTEEILEALGEETGGRDMVRRAYLPFTDEEKAEIRRLSAMGICAAEISRRIGGRHGKTTVRNLIRRMEKAEASDGGVEPDKPDEADETDEPDEPDEPTPVVTVTDAPEVPDLTDGFEMIERELTELLGAEETLLGELGAVRERIAVIRVRLQGLLGLAGGVDDG